MRVHVTLALPHSGAHAWVRVRVRVMVMVMVRVRGYVLGVKG